MNFIEYAPVANSATQRSICPFEKFHVSIVWIGTHVLKCIVDVLDIGPWHVAKIARGRLSEYQVPCHAAIYQAKRNRLGDTHVYLR